MSTKLRDVTYPLIRNMRLTLDYPLTRPFPSTALAPLAYAAGVLALGILAILNTALTAYQITTEPSEDFNKAWDLWYMKFLPASAKKAGENCDPAILSAGSIISTTNAVFLWTVDRVLQANAGRSSFQYKGTDLSYCDITRVYIDGEMLTRSATIQAFAQCDPVRFKKDKPASYTLRTSFRIAELAPPSISTILGSSTQGSPEKGYAGKACDTLISASGTDLLDQLLAFLKVNPEPAINVLGATADMTFCPAFNSSGASCQTGVPQFEFSSAGIGYSNGTFRLQPGDGTVITPFIAGPINNIVQAVAACARIDFGQSNQNNMLVNPQAAVSSGTYIKEFPASNGVAAFSTRAGNFLSDPSVTVINGTQQIPVPNLGASTYDVTFSCREKSLKSPGEAAIAVLVATLSMFMSGWAAFMFICIFFLKRWYGDDANACISHHNDRMAQIRPQAYTMPSTMSDYSKQSQAPMPSPDATSYPATQVPYQDINTYQYQPQANVNSNNMQTKMY